MNNKEEFIQQYKERHELILRQYQTLGGNYSKLEEWCEKEYGYNEGDLMTLLFLGRYELIIEQYKASGLNRSQTKKWYEETFKDDIDIGDAETIVEVALEDYNLPQNTPEQSIVDEVAKHNLAPSEIMANYMPSKEKSKGCMITILIMITATSLTSLLFL